MELFEKKFRLSMSSKVALLNRITHYIVNRKGKQMRPMFVFLTSGVIGEISERTYRAASFIELLHRASLVHDDVVDDSNYRRGFFSINALWKNKIAVLVGDYMLTRSLLLAVENGDFQPSPERTPGTYSKYNGIDDKVDDFHYYTTYISFMCDTSYRICRVVAAESDARHEICYDLRTLISCLECRILLQHLV